MIICRMSKTLNILFYSSLFIAAFSFFLPPAFLLGTYTPNLLGWLTLTQMPISISLFLYLAVSDIGERSWKGLKQRTVILFLTLLIITCYWRYTAQTLGNIQF